MSWSPHRASFVPWKGRATTWDAFGGYKDGLEAQQQRLLVGAVVIGPVLGALVFGALGLGASLMAATALSWMFLPLLVFGGAGLLVGGSILSGVFAVSAGGFLLFNLVKLGVLGGALFLGAKFAQTVFNFDAPWGGSSSGQDRERRRPTGSSTIDVDADPVDDWKDEALREQRRRDAELREFDDLLKRREEFKRGGGPGRGL
ncbi:hypothetical protein N2152v2_000523 [Parachlorella kessleri]